MTSTPGAGHLGPLVPVRARAAARRPRGAARRAGLRPVARREGRARLPELRRPARAPPRPALGGGARRRPGGGERHRGPPDLRRRPRARGAVGGRARDRRLAPARRAARELRVRRRGRRRVARDPARARGRRAGADRGLRRSAPRRPMVDELRGVGRARARPGGPQARRDALPHADPAGARGAGRPAARAHPALPRRRGAAAPGAGPGRAAARLRDVRDGRGLARPLPRLLPLGDRRAGRPAGAHRHDRRRRRRRGRARLAARERQRRALDPAGRDPRQGERDGRPRRVRHDDRRAAGRRAAGRGAAVRRPALQRARGSRASASA